MKKFLKIILEIVLVLVVLSLILVFLTISAKSEIVPDIYVSSDSGRRALAVRGGYVWNSFSTSIVADAIGPEDYVYTSNNTLLVTPGEKMTFKNSENPLDCYKFYQLEMKYLNESHEVFELSEEEDSKIYADLKYLELNAPEEEGTYLYNFKFSYYTKGEVSYGLKVVVSTEPNYDITDLIHYKNTDLANAEAINQIINLLPYAKYKTSIIVKINPDSRELVINYEEFVMERKELTNNIIALFTLIPNLDLVTYQAKEDRYVFTREEIENQVGRELVDYAEDVELWEKEILFKEKRMDEKVSRDTIYKAMIADIVSEFDANEIDKILIDTNSFKEAENLKISDVDRQEILHYVSNFSPVVYDITYENYKLFNAKDLFIGLVAIKDKATFLKEEASGDIVMNPNANIEEDGNNYRNVDYENIKGKYICTVMFSKNKRNSLATYEVEFKNEKWNITEL